MCYNKHMNYYDEYSVGHLVLPSALLAHFDKLFPSAFDFLVWLYFYENREIAPSDIATQTGKSLNDVNQAIDRLAKFGTMKVALLERDGEMETFFDTRPAFQKLDQLVTTGSSELTQPQQEEGQLKTLVSMFEAEMGMISPVQMEELRAWLFEEHYDFQLIQQALREAVLNRKVSLNYIKAILRNWKNDGVTSLHDVEEKQSERYQNKSKVTNESFYIPLEGPWDN